MPVLVPCSNSSGANRAASTAIRRVECRPLSTFQCKCFWCQSKARKNFSMVCPLMSRYVDSTRQKTQKCLRRNSSDGQCRVRMQWSMRFAGKHHVEQVMMCKVWFSSVMAPVSPTGVVQFCGQATCSQWHQFSRRVQKHYISLPTYVFEFKGFHVRDPAPTTVQTYYYMMKRWLNEDTDASRLHFTISLTGLAFRWPAMLLAVMSMLRHDYMVLTCKSPPSGKRVPSQN